MALLYEHGGVSIRLPNIIAMTDLNWTEELIKGTNMTESQRKLFKCQLDAPQVLLLHKDNKNIKGGVEFIDDVIIAKPKAKIFVNLLNDISNIFQEGLWPYRKYNITTVNSDTLAVSFPAIVEALLNIYQ